MKNFNNQSRRSHSKPQRQQSYEQHQSRPYNDHNGYHKAENSTRSFSRKENSDVNFHAPHKRNFDKFNNNHIKNVQKSQRNEQSQSNSRSQSRDTHYHSKQKQKYDGNAKTLSTINQESDHKKPSPVKPSSPSPKAESNRIGITHSLTGLRQEEGPDAVNKENGSSRQIQLSQKIQAKLTQKAQDLQKKTEEEKLQSSINIKAAENTELRVKEVEGKGKGISPKETQMSEESENLEIEISNHISSPQLTDSLKTSSESTSLLEKRSKIGDELDGDILDDEIKQIEAGAQVSKKLKADSKQGVIVTRRETAEKIQESLKALNALIEETSKRLSPQQKQNLMEIENNKKEKPLSQRLLTVLNFFDNFNINK